MTNVKKLIGFKSFISKVEDKKKLKLNRKVEGVVTSIEPLKALVEYIELTLETYGCFFISKEQRHNVLIAFLWPSTEQGDYYWYRIYEGTSPITHEDYAYLSQLLDQSLEKN